MKNFDLLSQFGSGIKLKPRRRENLLLLGVFLAMTVVFSYSFMALNFQIFDPGKGQVADKSETTESYQEPSRILEKTVVVSVGDTLNSLLLRAGVSKSEAHAVISSLDGVFNPRHLRQSHELNLTFEAPENEDHLFQGMSLKLDPTQEIQVMRDPEHGFVTQKIVHELATRPVRAEGEITSSLYSAAINSGVPAEVLLKLIRAYSFNVDFQRDIQPGDRFEVLFKELIDNQGKRVSGGEVLYAKLNTKGRDLAIFRYQTTDGRLDFFNEEGRSVRRALMLTPIDGARISSGFGTRRHPILGFNRKHQGLDFAAPTGTPIMAAGDGMVEFVGAKSAFGNTIRLRHANGYHTLYAHLSRFGAGIRKGARVSQGQTIGYVGSTGLSTGPHLHFEVHQRGRPINPAKMDSSPDRTLTGEELRKFMAAQKDLKILFASLKARENLAGEEDSQNRATIDPLKSSLSPSS